MPALCPRSRRHFDTCYRPCMEVYK